MKRSFAILAAAALLASPMRANAQGLGLIGGWSYGAAPNQNGALPGTLKSNSGFAFGLAAESGGSVGFGANLLYAQRGFSSSVTGFSQHLSYLDVPVYLTLSIRNPVVAPFAFVGPQESFELNCDGGNCPSGRPKNGFAGIIGAGLRFPMMDNLSIQGRYVYGLTNLNYSTVSNSSNYKTRSFLLLVGIGF